MINTYKDRELVNWITDTLTESLRKSREKGRGGWYDDRAVTDETLLRMSNEHLERDDDQIIDAAVLLFMVAFRRNRRE